MEEARAVLRRLRRLELLERADAPPWVLLAEVQDLLAAAEAWVAVETGTEAAKAALERCRPALASLLAS